MPATKIGKEWRIALSDVETFVGRTLPRVPEPLLEDSERLAEKPTDGAVSPTPAGENIERRLRNFLKPRDHVLALATKKEDLANLERAFWRVALASGGLLLIPHAPGQAKEVRRELTDMGFDTRMLRREGSLQITEVKGAREARRTLHLEAGKRPTVWVTYGLANSLSVPSDLALEHAYELDAACVTCNAIILSGWVVNRKNWSHSDAWRLETVHRGLIRMVGGDIFLARYS